MLEQQNNALTALAFFTESKVGKTGLTVTCDVYEGTSAIVTGASATEIGTSGTYYYTLSSGSVDANALYLFMFKTATTSVDVQHIPALWIVGRTWVNNIDTTTSSRLAPTTSGRTLDVTSTGEAGVDWANVGSPTTTLNLSGTTVKHVTDDVTAANLDVAVSTRAPSSTALSTSTWTNALATNISSTNSTVSTNLDNTVSSRAPSSTALSTSTWTGGLATNIATTNSTIATNLDATVSSRSSHSASDVITGLLNQVITSFTTTSTVGKVLNNILTFLTAAPAEKADYTAVRAAKLDNLDTTVSSRSSHSVSDIWNNATRTLTSYGTLVADIVAGTITPAQVWSYITRTLTSSGGSLTASDVWTYGSRTLTMSAAEIEESLTGSNLSILRGDTYSVSLTGLGDLTNYGSVLITAKDDYSLADNEALFQIRLNDPDVNSGLIYLYGVDSPTASYGSITIDDLALGDITIDIDEEATKRFPVGANYHYDIQLIRNSVVTTLTIASLAVTEDYTRTTT